MPGTARRVGRNRTKSTTAINDDKDPYENIKNQIRKNRSRDHSFIGIADVNIKILLSCSVIASLVVFFVVHHIREHPEDDYIPRVITPLPAPKLMDLPMFQGDHKESLYWGTYRAHVYLGIRSRTPESLIFGLMWIGVKDGRYLLRHVCQDADDLKTYGWTRHNGRDYGHQIIIDQDLTLTTTFLKSKGDGSGYGGDWAVRINVDAKSGINYERLRVTHLFFYVADESGNALSLGKGVTESHDKSVLATGSRVDVGDWQLHLESKDKFETHYIGFRTPHIHNLSDLVLENLAVQTRNYGRVQLPDTSDVSSNILVFQIATSTSFEGDFAFVSGTSSDSTTIKDRVSSLTGTLLTGQLEEKHNEFNDKFKRCFNLSDKLDPESVAVGKAAVGNLLGGIGYFYGQSKISYPKNSIYNKGGDNFINYWPAELYTAVPSRPFFPRGFLWDEGFHQLLIWRWDIRMSLDIIGHWLDLMNIDGWIPREQILGPEALSKVPEEFVVQYPSNGNPPTLFLVLREVVCSMKREELSVTERNNISSFLDRAFVRLESWFQWFNTTQSGKSKSSYFWHGRDGTTTRELNPKTLSSGLDDYPRASHPSEDERHLDLRCWMYLASDCMHSISKFLLKESEIGKEYGLTSELLSDFELLNQLHFENEYGAYFDFGNHTEKVRLSRQMTDVGPSQELVREVLKKPKPQLVPHIGYVSLFPFMAMLIPPQSWILEKQLDIISNKSTLWTDFGLRSLSRTSTMYMKRNTEHDPPYWRGPIWMNINYMILSALHHYSIEGGPYRERAKSIYNELRDNLIKNVVSNYERSGYLWEQYDQKNGKGKGAHPFTGWTSLILLIMSESYSHC